MVSIRYFSGVGEFCSVKSSPRRSFTSKVGAASAIAEKRRKFRRLTRERIQLVSLEVGMFRGALSPTEHIGPNPNLQNLIGVRPTGQSLEPQQGWVLG